MKKWKMRLGGGVLIGGAALALLGFGLCRHFDSLAGKYGQELLRRVAPPRPGFNLRAREVHVQLPATVSLRGVTLTGGVQASTPRLDIGFSPWELLSGKFRIVSLHAAALRVHTPPNAGGILTTLTGLGAIPLRQWFPADLLPNTLHFDSLGVRSTGGRPLLEARRLLLVRNRHGFTVHGGELLLLGVLPTRDLQAAGHLPLALDSFAVKLPAGRARGKMSSDGNCLKLTGAADLALDSIALPLGGARISGHAAAKSFLVKIPLTNIPPVYTLHATAGHVRLSGFSYVKDSWVRRFTPGLGTLHFSSAIVNATGDLDHLEFHSLEASGTPLRLSGNGSLSLTDGDLSLHLRAGFTNAYVNSHSGLLRAALRPGRDGYCSTVASIHGTIWDMHVTPGHEAYDYAISHPLRSLLSIL